MNKAQIRAFAIAHGFVPSYSGKWKIWYFQTKKGSQIQASFDRCTEPFLTHLLGI